MFFKFYKLILLFIMTMLFMSSWSTVNAASTDDDCTAAKAMAADLFLIDATKINDSSEGANSCYNFFSLGSHAGIDLQTQDVAGDKTADRKFYALEDGEVVFTGGKYGDIAIYNDNKKTVVSYLHARKINPDLKVGISRVKKGDYLGVQGNVMPTSTDTTSNEHVHVEVLKLASKPKNRTTTLTKDKTSTSTDLVNPLEYFGYKTSCKSSNPSTATVTSVTVSRDDKDGTNFSNVNGVFQLKSSGDYTKYILTLEGTGFSDDSNCPSPITIDWELTPSNGQTVFKGEKYPVSKTESKVIFSLNEGSGADRLGNWKFTVKKGDQLIRTINAVSTMDDNDNASAPNCFSDISALDAEDKEKNKAICYLNDKGILNGYPDGTVKLNNPINRAEFVTVIMRSKEDDVNEGCAVKDEKPFADVKEDQWYYKAVEKAKRCNYINGYADGFFKPSNLMSKKEALKIIFTSILGVKHMDSYWTNSISSGLPSYEKCANILGTVNNFTDNATRQDVFLWLHDAIKLRDKNTEKSFDMSSCEFKQASSN